jgi:hypothetical protein
MTMTEPFATALLVSPLSVLVRGSLEWTFRDKDIELLFAQHAPAQYTRQLTISAVVELLLQVAAGVRRSVFAAFQADQARDQPTITASYQALYTKIGRTVPDFASSLVRHSADRLRPLLDRAHPSVPGWRGYQIQILDGTDLDGTEHRLKVLRHTNAAGLPGRLVVQYDLVRGLCTDAVASEDAYASEMVLVEPLIQRAVRGWLYVADRNFCTWDILDGLASRGARFIIREHQKLRWQSRGQKRRLGRVPTGEVWEEPLWVLDRHTGKRRKVRRIILKLDEPTRDGETEIRLLTNLPARVCGKRIAELYRKRWTLEGHFDFVKNALHGEIESLGRPRAALLMMCLALVAGNALAVVREALRVSQGVELADLSGYYLADELAGNYRAVDKLVSEACWEVVGTLAARECWSWCVAVAGQIRTAALQKHPRGPKGPKPKRASAKEHPHYSTFRLLNEAKLLC